MPKITSSNLVTIGIDPGLGGGAALIGTKFEILGTCYFTEDRRDIFKGLQNLQTIALKNSKGIMPRVGIELVSSRPAMVNGKVVQGVKSTFTFGVNYGYVLMACTALNLPLETIPPKTWQKFYHLARDKQDNSRQWKEKLLRKAQELYPDYFLWNKPRTKGIQLQISDAILIAHMLKANYEIK